MSSRRTHRRSNFSLILYCCLPFFEHHWTLLKNHVRTYRNKALGIILTGMGGDGAKGLLSMRKKGARTIGQDESTCVVYGMPKVAYDIGAVEYQEKLPDIAKRTYSLLGKM